MLVNTLHEVSLYKLEHKVTRMYPMAVYPHAVLLSVSVSLYSRGNIIYNFVDEVLSSFMSGL